MGRGGGCRLPPSTPPPHTHTPCIPIKDLHNFCLGQFLLSKLLSVGSFKNVLIKYVLMYAQTCLHNYRNLTDSVSTEKLNMIEKYSNTIQNHNIYIYIHSLLLSVNDLDRSKVKVM